MRSRRAAKRVSGGRREALERAELRPSSAKAKLARVRRWCRSIDVEGGPVLFMEQRIAGPASSFIGELGFTDGAPALVNYCDGCQMWSATASFAEEHRCGRRTRGWHFNLRRALLAALERRHGR